mmetsp:Transcript_6936/g.16214  ORF Transcript_6936/g.16214 Transcript_6936/m.16214 type:complete len:240 (-) Transcript_6936:1897-2616(-)
MQTSVSVAILMICTELCLRLTAICHVKEMGVRFVEDFGQLVSTQILLRVQILVLPKTILLTLMMSPSVPILALLVHGEIRTWSLGTVFVTMSMFMVNSSLQRIPALTSKSRLVQSLWIITEPSLLLLLVSLLPMITCPRSKFPCLAIKMIHVPKSSMDVQSSFMWMIIFASSTGHPATVFVTMSMFMVNSSLQRIPTLPSKSRLVLSLWRIILPSLLSLLVSLLPMITCPRSKFPCLAI